jgi:hypothetical protein
LEERAVSLYNNKSCGLEDPPKSKWMKILHGILHARKKIMFTNPSAIFLGFL